MFISSKEVFLEYSARISGARFQISAMGCFPMALLRHTPAPAPSRQLPTSPHELRALNNQSSIKPSIFVILFVDPFSDKTHM
jgi:hypothetical protein